MVLTYAKRRSSWLGISALFFRQGGGESKHQITDFFSFLVAIAALPVTTCVMLVLFEPTIGWKTGTKHVHFDRRNQITNIIPRALHICISQVKCPGIGWCGLALGALSLWNRRRELCRHFHRCTYPYSPFVRCCLNFHIGEGVMRLVERSIEAHYPCGTDLD